VTIFLTVQAVWFNPRHLSGIRLTQWFCETLVFVGNESAMQNVTVRLPEELVEELDAESDEQDVSRSEYIRETLQDRHETDELREEVSDLRETQLARRSEIEEKVDTLAKREQEGNAPFFIKWYRWWQRRE
jgi:Arc/MetJ-type ribon-helix-helix transcriptional regulator